MNILKFGLLTVLLTVVTWIGLNAGRVLYYDWSFLHIARITAEYQATHQPAPAK